MCQHIRQIEDNYGIHCMDCAKMLKRRKMITLNTKTTIPYKNFVIVAGETEDKIFKAISFPRDDWLKAQKGETIHSTGDNTLGIAESDESLEDCISYLKEELDKLKVDKTKKKTVK